jgi:transketolase
VFTHDSIGLGEDGPTHQPIEHLASLRLIPYMRVWRPADGAETAVAWCEAVERRDGPSCLVLSRQNLPAQPRTAEQLALIRRGGYVLKGDGPPDIILIATGSEVSLAVAAADQLAGRGYRVRVVSMPCLRVFVMQDDGYREAVLPAAVARRIVIEAGVPDAWHRWAGPSGRVIGISRFGESAPARDLFAHFGFTVDNVVKTALELFEE